MPAAQLLSDSQILRCMGAYRFSVYRYEASEQYLGGIWHIQFCETLMFMCEYCSTRKGKECDVCLGVIVCELHTQIHEQSQEHKYHLRRILQLELPLDTKST